MYIIVGCVLCFLVLAASGYHILKPFNCYLLIMVVPLLESSCLLIIPSSQFISYLVLNISFEWLENDKIWPLYSFHFLLIDRLALLFII